MNKKFFLVASLLSVAAAQASTPAPTAPEAPKVLTQADVDAAVVEAAKGFGFVPKLKVVEGKETADLDLDKDGKVQYVAVSKGYVEAAWSAVKTNRTMTAALVASAFFLGAVAHAAVSTNDVEDEA